jgi:chemotaxis protein methyltransferase CheR
LSVDLNAQDVEQFRETIADCLGLRFEDAKTGFLADVLGGRLVATNQDCAGYLNYVKFDRPMTEFAALANELTIPETYFYRNIDQFHAFSEQVVPERMKERSGNNQLRILSAGCASGEEAYTLAILLREVLKPGWKASVLAVDLNPSALQKAERGRFSPWSLRETPLAVQRRWFKHDGRDIVLDGEIKSAVRFEQRNLAEDDPDLWGDEQYDVVFCRNVVMYFTPEGGRALVDRITRSLLPNGFLFLGHAETLRGITQAFHLCHTHGTFYYQRRTEDDRSISALSPLSPRASRESTPLAQFVEGADTWVEAIRAASERVQQLVDEVPSPSAARGAVDITSAPHRVSHGEALVLLREERFEEALDVLGTLPLDSADDPDVLLLRAVLLTHTGLLGTAEEVCRRLLKFDELSASAHYVLALCRESAGDLSGAVEHDRIAVYLDPSFAMPRLHLGLLARRSNDSVAMRRELSQAITLLEHEDASRLLLFGGGFGRDALIELCHAEMRDRASS